MHTEDSLVQQPSRMPHTEYHMMHTEDSKVQLHLLIDDKSFRMKLQKESLVQLHGLLSKYKADPQNLRDESRDCRNKLRQLQDIEDKQQALQLSKDQMTLLLYIYTMHLFSDRGGDDMQTLAYRLKMLHERNDSIWLLCDGMDWILPKVHTFWMLQQTVGGNTTNQCPVDQQQDVPLLLLRKFTGRLVDWLGSVHKQQRLQKSLSMMLRCWPRYPWVR